MPLLDAEASLEVALFITSSSSLRSGFYDDNECALVSYSMLHT